MRDHELKAIIASKNAAWQALAEADRHCLAYQRSRYTSEGYAPLPEGWEDRREQLAQAYRQARGAYLEAMLRRRRR